MVSMILDQDLEEQLIKQRQESGGDHHDEVWEGIYMMSPLANNEHQEIISGFTSVFQIVIAWPGLGIVLPGTNISDQLEDWTHNYRVPDVVVFLQDTKAINRDTHWLGGPDFAVEVLSRGDRAREKLPFYAKVGTREVLLVDRNPWSLELYRLQEGTLGLVGRSTPQASSTLSSEVLPLTFRLLATEKPGERPRIAVSHQDGQQHWTV
jgi:Uma2 family endonuclease